jgi:hypothetical protein
VLSASSLRRAIVKETEMAQLDSMADIEVCNYLASSVTQRPMKEYSAVSDLAFMGGLLLDSCSCSKASLTPSKWLLKGGRGMPSAD